ncbi:hypothetical protein VTI74DRAFT_9323 [Chaetomium olivicolor]
MIFWIDLSNLFPAETSPRAAQQISPPCEAGLRPSVGSGTHGLRKNTPVAGSPGYFPTYPNKHWQRFYPPRWSLAPFRSQCISPSVLPIHQVCCLPASASAMTVIVAAMWGATKEQSSQKATLVAAADVRRRSVWAAGSCLLAFLCLDGSGRRRDFAFQPCTLLPKCSIVCTESINTNSSLLRETAPPS